MNPVEDSTDIRVESDGTVVLINIFKPKNGDLESFVEAQIGEYKRQRGLAAGWIGNSLCRSVDGKSAVNIAVFESLERYREWRDSAHFSEHLEIIRPYIESSQPGMYLPVYGDSVSRPGEGVLALG